MHPDITLEDYHSWLAHPVTQAVKASRDKDIKEVSEFIASGGTLDGDSTNSTALQTALQVGYIKGLREALNAPTHLISE